MVAYDILKIEKNNNSKNVPSQFKGDRKNELSVIGEGCELGDKVTLKQCSIGKGCHIGAKSKLNNCIIMDHTKSE